MAKLIPHDPRLAVAAMEIGAVGFQVWPTRIIDLAGIVTPGAVGVLPYEFFKRREPDYLVLRTDDAAAFLRSAESDPWFTQNYALLARVIDPYVSRSFVAYRAIHRTASPE